MKKPYTEPTIEEIVILLKNALNGDVIHSSFEKGGLNSDWDFNDDDDEGEFGDLFG